MDFWVVRDGPLTQDTVLGVGQRIEFWTLSGSPGDDLGTSLDLDEDVFE